MKFKNLVLDIFWFHSILFEVKDVLLHEFVWGSFFINWPIIMDKMTETKISENQITTLSHHYILEMKVTVDHSLWLDHFNDIRHLRCPFHDLIELKSVINLFCCVLVDDMFKVFAFDEFKNKIFLITFIKGVDTCAQKVAAWQ